MKKFSSKKKRRSALAITASLALLCGIVTAGIIKSNSLSEGGETSKKEEGVEEGILNNGVQAKLLSTSTNSNGEITKVFTYSVNPSNASQVVTADLSWQDKTYTGDVSQYMTVSVDTTAKQITLVCLQAFDHVIEAKITSAIDSSLYSLVTLNYVQRFLKFVVENEFSDIMFTETIDEATNPSNPSVFIASQTTQETARYKPTFSEVYTKEYPSGHRANYTMSFKKIEPYINLSSVGQELRESYRAAMNEVQTDAGTDLWMSSSASEIIEGIAKIYEKLSYALQRKLNKAGYIGIERVYTVNAELDENAKKTYSTGWVLQVDVTTLRSYLSDVTVNPEAANIDF